MKTHLSLTYEHDTDLPEGVGGEVRTPPALVRRFLREYTDPGDAVFDPFAGFGTTLAVAAELNRTPYGIEYEPDRVEYVQTRFADDGWTDAPSDRVRQGNVLDADLSWVPPATAVFTSPPFMERTDTRNPFENYAGESDYATYLDDIEAAFVGLVDVLAAGGTLVVDVSNLKHEGRVTTLAWDVADRLSGHFDFQGEIVVTWEASDDNDRDGAFGYGYDHSYCLVFRNEE